MRRPVLTSLAIACTLLLSAIPAQAHDHHSHNRHVSKQYRKAVKRHAKRARKAARWEWNRHNWNDQRAYLNNNWRTRSARISAAQRAQLDAQLRQQWLGYHNNNWNGQYNWDQYNDPRFFDYIHDRNPGLLTTIRNALGIF